MAVTVLLAALTAFAFALGLAVGARSVDIAAMLRLLVGLDTCVSPDDAYVLREMRLPRTVVALVAGGILAVAGGLIQALTRNPLADTGILGVDAGAAAAVTAGVAFTGVSSISGLGWFAFIGALLTTVAVHVLGASGRLGTDPARLVLAGLALGAVLSGLSGLLALGDPETFDNLRIWMAGSLMNRTYEHLVPLLPYLGPALVLALVVTRPLNAIALGDEVAAAQGVRVRLVRACVVIAITLLAGSSTAICGPIGFVGLMVPHIVRWAVGPDQTWLLPLSFLGGATLLMLADVLGRTLLAPGEIPAGIITAFVGAPVLIALVRMRRRVSGL